MSPPDEARSPEPEARPDRLGFWLAVFVVLVFSGGWITAISGPDGDPEASGVIRVLYLPAYAATLALLASAPRRSLLAAVHAPVLWLLIGLVFLSTLWSVDAETTTRRAVAVAFTSLAGVVIAARFDWPNLARVLATSFAILAALSLAVGLGLPNFGRMSDIFPGAWRGLWSDKNGLGDKMALGAVIALAAAILNPTQRRLWLGVAALAFGLILLSTSKTSLVSLCAGLAALGFVGVVRRGPALALLASTGAFAFIAVISLALTLAPEQALGMLGKDATFTGRTKIWAAALRQIHQRPWTGYGYAAVWTNESLWSPLAWIAKDAGFRPHHAHNSWLQIWLELGLVGLGLWALYWLETLARAILAAYRSPGAYFALPFLVVFSLTSLTEVLALDYNDFIWLIFTALATRLALGRRLMERAEVRAASTSP